MMRELGSNNDLNKELKPFIQLIHFLHL